jgi:hypothetical protein
MLSGSEGTTAELIVNTAYPIGDLLLVSMVVAFIGFSGTGRGRSWLLLGALPHRPPPMSAAESRRG